jgi:hypothetical protein
VGIYYLRGRRGAPFYSIIAALQCLQPYTENMLRVGRNRIIGTLVGAFWGAVVVFGALGLSGGALQYDESLLYYLALVLFIGIVLYSTVVLGIRESAYFSAVVFLSITMNHIGDTDPYLFVFNRTMDTVIGVAAAILINSLHLPRVRDRETLFVSGVDHVLFREDRRLSPFTKVQLNRFLQDGMRFSVSTKQTPATVREVMAGVDLRLPIIAMDGAVLYDMKTRTYLRTAKMDSGLAEKVSAFLSARGCPFYVNTVEENLLVIYSRGYRLGTPDPQGTAQQAMQALYDRKKGSPYRNYINAGEDVTENVLYFLIVDRREKVRELYESLMREPWADGLRGTLDTLDCREGEEILRVYSSMAVRREMLKELAAYTGAEKTVLFGTDRGECDVVIPDAGGGHMVKELKKRYEPVSLRGWRNILHF